MTNIKGKEILKKLAERNKGDRKRVSLYLSESLYKQFGKACGEIPPSQVMEELMADFLKSVNRSKVPKE